MKDGDILIIMELLWIIMELLALFVHLYCYLTNYLKLSQLYSLCQVI